VKRCKKCGESKPESEFYRAAGCRDGLRPECKACNLAAKHKWYRANRQRAIERSVAWQRANRDRYNARMRVYRSARTELAREEHLKRSFGLTLAEYEALLGGQGSACAICGDEPSPKRALHVDHDHDSGAIRGLICMRCNNALGLLRDRLDVVFAAADYLETRPAERLELEAAARERVAALSASGA
jgi:hypothetical protein